MTRASGTATPIAIATASSVAICSLPAPARSAAMPARIAAPGTSRAAADDQRPPAILLVAILGQAGQRKGAQQIGVERRDIAHRAATIASGAEVTGAASSISGAAKL